MTILMQHFRSQDSDSSRIQLNIYQHQTSRQELHDEIQVSLVLEAVEHLDHPGTICLHQDIPLCPDMSNLQGDRQPQTQMMQQPKGQCPHGVFFR